jgi:hypothetical protein
MNEAQKKHYRSFNSSLNASIRRSLESLGAVCGYMVFFSVLIELLHHTGLDRIITAILTPVFAPLGFDNAIIAAFNSGLFEMTLGVKAVSGSAAPLGEQIAAASMVIAWGGFSIQAQVSGMISNTDIKPHIYFICRIAQALLALAATTVWLRIYPTVTSTMAIYKTTSDWVYIIWPMLISLAALLVPFLGGLAAYILGKWLRLIR